MSASLQHFGRGALRVAKNYTKGYTETQTKVRDATSNDPWGPSGTQMNEVAQLTYNQNDFVEIMEMLDKRLNDKGKNWRHVFKALTLLDYCLHAGSENVVIYFKDNIYIIKTLKEFVYTDDDQKDVGSNVRQKAKDITNLLADEDRLRAERRSRGAMRDRMLGNIADSGLKGEEDYGGPRPAERDREPARRPQNRPNNNNEEDDLRKAIEESKRMMDEEATRRSRVTQEEDDLRRAMRESEEDEAKRKRERESANERALFDDSINLQSNNQYQPPQQQMGYPLIDTGYGQQQPLQPQFTSYNPFHMQMMQQEQARLQQEEYMRQQMLLQQQQQQQQQEEYMRQQMLLQQQQQQQAALMAQPTGYRSNNPFAPSTSFLGSNNPGTSFGQQPQQASSSFIPVPTVQPQQQQQMQQPSPPKPQPQQQQARPVRDDGQHAGLANLLARGREDGMDTFGNTGNLRVPTGSAFHQSNRLHVQQTGFGANNPFGQPAGQQQQQQQQKPADQPFFSI